MKFIFHHITTSLYFVFLLVMIPHYPAQGFPTDHQGEDLLITEDTKLSGEHLNINRFHVATSTTLSVSLYKNEGYGWLIIRAQEIEIDGIVDAAGAGYTGGGGGQGGGFTGNVGHGRYPGFDGVNGDGSSADGVAGSGFDGGYNTPGANTDTTTDESLLMGSGGRGGYGGSSGGAGVGGGGGGGGCGGGYIKLYAQNSLVVRGKVLTHGMRGQNGGDAVSVGSCYLRPDYPWGYGYVAGEGGKGGDAWPPDEGQGGEEIDGPCDSDASNGGVGYSGAGGGVLLKCEALNGLDISGEINAYGGTCIYLETNPDIEEYAEENGGSLKIFSPSPVFLGRADIKVGRLYVDAPPLQQVGWELY